MPPGLWLGAASTWPCGAHRQVGSVRAAPRLRKAERPPGLPHVGASVPVDPRSVAGALGALDRSGRRPGVWAARAPRGMLWVALFACARVCVCVCVCVCVRRALLCLLPSPPSLQRVDARLLLVQLIFSLRVTVALAVAAGHSLLGCALSATSCKEPPSSPPPHVGCLYTAVQATLRILQTTEPPARFSEQPGRFKDQ
jgi:hypothetical protein